VICDLIVVLSFAAVWSWVAAGPPVIKISMEHSAHRHDSLSSLTVYLMHDRTLRRYQVDCEQRLGRIRPALEQVTRPDDPHSACREGGSGDLSSSPWLPLRTLIQATTPGSAQHRSTVASAFSAGASVIEAV
jgi:hypothetical protein